LMGWENVIPEVVRDSVRPWTIPLSTSAILFEPETSTGQTPWNGIIFPGDLPADRGTGSLVPRAD
jgi:hypothetical protein